MAKSQKPEPREGQTWTTKPGRDEGHSVRIIGTLGDKWLVESLSTKREYRMSTRTLHAKFRLVTPENPAPVDRRVAIGAPGV